MAIELVTGRAGTPHISSADDRAYNAYTDGSGRYLLHGGGCTMQSANNAHLAPAEFLVDGAHVRITGLGEDVAIDNGASSYKRIDIVALHYSSTGGGDTIVETMALEVVKGTPADSDPVEPDMPSTGSLLDGATDTYIPLYRIAIDGLTPGTPELMLDEYDKSRVKLYGDATDVQIGSETSDGQNVFIGVTSPTGSRRLLGYDDRIVFYDGGENEALYELMAPFKLLWSGTWTKGTITAEGLSNYNMVVFIVLTDNGTSKSPSLVLGLRQLGIKDSEFVAFSNDAWDLNLAASSAQTAMKVIVSGDELTYPKVFSRLNAENDFVYLFSGITHIYGVM